MELQFNQSACPCLETVLREGRNQELTQEIKLTDGMPDIGRVLAAWGQGILRGKEWRGDSISLSGGMMVWVLYVPEDGSGARTLEGWIPFQMKWELPDGTPEGEIRVSPAVRFVDARSVAARKLMIRAGMAVLAEVLAPCEAKIYTPREVPSDVELLRSQYPLRLPREAGEKTFLMDEDLTMPGSIPQPERLVYYTVQPEVTDKKVLANKVVFRGNGNLHVLYESEEGQLHSWDFELPFSQFDELKGSYSGDAQADMMVTPTSLELDLDDEGHMRLKCGLVGQYRIDDMELLEIVEDAYSPSRELGLRTEMLELPAVLENRRENIYGEQAIPVEADAIADVRFLPDLPRQRQTEKGVEIEVPGLVQLLYYGENRELQSANARWEGRQTVEADEQSRIAAMPQPGPEPQFSQSNGGMNVKVQLPMEMTTTTVRGIPMVTGLELGEEKEADPNRPSLILRRAGDARLWDMAKASGSTVEAIRKANGLQEEPQPGQMLLIPVS